VQEKVEEYLRLKGKFVRVHTLSLPDALKYDIACYNLVKVECPFTDEMCVLIGNNPNLSSLSVTGYLDDRRCEALQSAN